MNRNRLNRRNVRKLVITENISLYNKKINLEKRKLNEKKIIYKKILEYKNNKRNLKEFKLPGMESILDFGKNMLSSYTSGGLDVAKDYVIDLILGFLGIEKSDTLWHDTIRNALENVKLGDVTGLFTGKTKIDNIIEIMLRGAVEGMAEYGIAMLYDKIKENEILSMIVPNQEELFGKVSGEVYQNQLADFLVPKIMPKVKEFIKSKGFSVSDDKVQDDTLMSPVADVEQKVETLSEMYLISTYASIDRINNYNKKIKLLKNNL